MTEKPKPPTHLRDIGRSLTCAAIVALCVASPSATIILAPIVPVLVALRFLRFDSSNRRFLVSTVAACLVAAVLSAGRDKEVVFASLLVLILVPILGRAHATYALRTPLSAGSDRESMPWTEPLLGSGLTPLIALWSVAVILVSGSLIWALDVDQSVTGAVKHIVAEAYAPYTTACADGGRLAGQASLCEQIDAQRVTVSRYVDRNTYELLAGIAAIFAFGSAASVHLIVITRAKNFGNYVREVVPIERLEMHWVFAYVCSAGVVAWLASIDLKGDAETLARVISIFLVTIGAGALSARGLGFATWSIERGRRPSIGYVVLAIAAFLMPWILLPFLFLLGMLDQMLQPRRRVVKQE